VAERLSRRRGSSAVIRHNRPEDVVEAVKGSWRSGYRAPLNVLQELSCAGGDGLTSVEVYTETQSKKPGAMQGGLTNG
jgi:hypothetical protein